MSTEGPAALVRAARAGHREAFGGLYRLYGRMVHGILLAHGPRHEVEDLVQEVFLSAWDRIHTLREPRAFGHWLAQMARNRAVDALRARRGTEPLDEETPAPESS